MDTSTETSRSSGRSYRVPFIYMIFCCCPLNTWLLLESWLAFEIPRYLPDPVSLSCFNSSQLSLSPFSHWVTCLCVILSLSFRQMPPLNRQINRSLQWGFTGNVQEGWGALFGWYRLVWTAHVPYKTTALSSKIRRSLVTILPRLFTAHIKFPRWAPSSSINIWPTYFSTIYPSDIARYLRWETSSAVINVVHCGLSKESLKP